MARQIINVGTTANDGTGDGLRTAYIKCNDNFQELYNTTITPIQVINGTSNIGILTEDGNATIAINGTANVVVFSQNIANIDANLQVTGDITGAGNVTGNDFYVGDILTVTGTVGSNLTPDGNGTRSLGTTSSRWSDLFLSGSTLTLGGIVFKDNGSNVLGIFGPDGITPATIQSTTIDTSIISNGTSNIQIVGTDGDAAISVDGTSNVVVVTSDTVTVAGNVDATNVNATSAVVGGNIIATGNVDAGNINVMHVTASGFFQGDGGLLSNVTAVSNVAATQLANGSSIISFDGSGGNIQLTVGAVQVANVTTGGANINGYVDATGAGSFAGNLSGGNLITAGLASITGNVTGGNVVSLGNLTGNSLTLTGNVTGVVSLSASGNIDAANLNLTQDAVVTANINGGNVSSNDAITAVGNISGGNLIVTGVVTATGNVTGDYFVGNGSQLTGIDATAIQNGTSNVTVAVANGNVTISVAGSTKALFTTGGANITGNANVSGAITATGNITGGNIITGGRLTATGNISGSSISASGLANISGNITGGNLITNGVITATGNITGGNLTASSGIANVALLVTQTGTFSTLANITATTESISTTTGSLKTAGGAGIVGNIHVGGLASVTGNITGGNIIAGGDVTAGAQVVATGNITGGNIITAGVASVSSIVKTGSNGVGNIGQTTNRFNTVFAQATSAQYADLAERYASDAEYAPGTVLVFGGSAEVTVSIRDADPTVAGVVSSKPAYLMNDALDSEYSVALALVGRVPTRVKGPVRRGQMLVSTVDGFARAESNPSMGTVIGKALEDFDGDQGIIEAVIGRL